MKAGMARYNESLPKTEIPENKPHIIEYPGLVEAVQLSVARLMDIPGAAGARSFSEILEKRSQEAREKLICEVGGGFDQQLIAFVTSTLIDKNRRNIVIRADESEGVDGYLPWERALSSHLKRCRENGYFTDASVSVERYSAIDDELEELVEQAQILAA